MRTRVFFRTGILPTVVFSFVSSLAAQTAPSVPLPAGITKGASVEGITEYDLSNGLRVLLFPDPTKTTTT
ncbi:MAG: hypothetical protein JO217_03135, partial [Acidobacteriaceae bacterium]|nr:hypothetical protein [Acidobacteriaceae bacterium]